MPEPIEPLVPSEPQVMPEIVPQRANCTGCGIKLQTKDPKITGFINPKYIKAESEPEIPEPESLDTQEEALFAHLHEIGASPEIISEFRNHAERKTNSVEILDLDTLVQMDEAIFSDEAKIKLQIRDRKKLAYVNIC